MASVSQNVAVDPLKPGLLSNYLPRGETVEINYAFHFLPCSIVLVQKGNVLQVFKKKLEQAGFKKKRSDSVFWA